MGTRELHEQARRMKEAQVRDHGPSDLAPLLLAAFDDQTTYLGTVTEGTEAALEAGVRMGDLVGASLIKLRSTNDNQPLCRVMLVTEGYVSDVDPDAPSPEHGALAERYANEPDSGVSEGLVTSTWNYNGSEMVFEMAMTPFHYTDGGVLVWGETQGPMATDGHISEQARKAMR